jgi:hypothetical protein
MPQPAVLCAGWQAYEQNLSAQGNGGLNTAAVGQKVRRSLFRGKNHIS